MAEPFLSIYHHHPTGLTQVIMGVEMTVRPVGRHGVCRDTGAACIVYWFVQVASIVGMWTMPTTGGQVDAQIFALGSGREEF